MCSKLFGGSGFSHFKSFFPTRMKGTKTSLMFVIILLRNVYNKCSRGDMPEFKNKVSA